MTRTRILEIARTRGTAAALVAAKACKEQHLIDAVNRLIAEEQCTKLCAIRPVSVWHFNTRGAAKFARTIHVDHSFLLVGERATLPAFITQPARRPGNHPGH